MKNSIKRFKQIILAAAFLTAISAVNISAATFTVTNTNDSGAGSLRQAILDANQATTADTIVFDASFNTARTITLAGTTLTITGNATKTNTLTITGPGANLLTISGNNASRIFTINTDAVASISGLTITQGNDSNIPTNVNNGGGIKMSNAIVNLTNLVITGNTSVSSGGGVYNEGSGTGNTQVSVLNISGCTISNNIANGDGGGGIFITGYTATTISNSGINSNQALFISGRGGGITYRLAEGQVTIANSTINGNSAKDDGGGVYGTANQPNSFSLISNTTISNNTANSDNIPNGNGGGLYLSSSFGMGATITNSTISGNQVFGNNPNNSANGNGGGLVADGLVNLINSTVSGNSAGLDFGGVYRTYFGGSNLTYNINVISSTIVNNTAARNTGGIGLLNGSGNEQKVIMQNSIVANNTAGGVSSDIGQRINSRGYNLIKNPSGASIVDTTTGNVIGVDPQLGALANNGGLTQTHALISGSPAINAGSNALAVDQNGNPLRYDQRDACYARIVGATVDIGAFEFGAIGTCTSNGKTVGVFRPTNGITYLRNSNTGGFADINMVYGVNGDTSIAGDWNGDRVDSLGIYRNGVFYLRNSNTTGPADIVFAFGSPGDQPIAGDWNGDGIDTIGVYRQSTGVFMLRNSNTSGAPDVVFVLGNPGDVAIAGDWNGDGVTTTGVFRPTNGIIYLKNTNVSGDADIGLVYGNAGDKPVAGDWNADGIDSIGIYRNGVFYLRNSNTQGFADIVFAFGNPGDEPIAGDWDGLP